MSEPNMGINKHVLMISRAIIVVFAFSLSFSCRSPIEELAENHECEYCRHYFKNNTSIAYLLTRYQIGKDNQTDREGRRDVESIHNRAYFGGWYIRAVQRKEAEKFSRHLPCFIGQDKKFLRKFLSKKIAFNVKKEANFMDLDFQFDIGEYGEYSNVLDWQKQNTHSLRFEKRKCDFIYTGDWRDSLKLDKCIKK